MDMHVHVYKETEIESEKRLTTLVRQREGQRDKGTQRHRAKERESKANIKNIFV